MYKDLESLVSDCYNKSTKDYMKEAVACYNGGAYKACITATWLAVVYDLIEKIKQLSQSGDGCAKNIMQRFNNIRDMIDRGDPAGISASLGFEREILDKAKQELEIIDDIQYEELSRIRTDRNKCAHPSFLSDGNVYNVHPEVARSHMRTAVEYVLKNPPLQGKVAMDGLITMINSDFFPKNCEQIVQEFENSALKNSKYILQKNFIDELFFSLFEENRAFSQKRGSQAVELLNACNKFLPGVTYERVLLHINTKYQNLEDSKIYILLALVTRSNVDLWKNLNDGVKNKLKMFITTTPNKTSVSISFPWIEDIPELQDAVASYKQSLTLEELKHMMSTVLHYGAKKIMYARAVELYIENRDNWNQANTVAYSLLIPNADYMTGDLVNKILEAFTLYPDAIKDSISLPDVVNVLYKEAKRWGMGRDNIDNVLQVMGRTQFIMSQDAYDALEEDIPF